jgi:hypothetical protein
MLAYRPITATTPKRASGTSRFVANKAADGWTLAGQYVGQASGETANRPEFQRAFVLRRTAVRRSFCSGFSALY